MSVRRFHQTTTAGSSNTVNPTSYIITSVTLTTNAGEDYDIKDAVAGIEIFESIYSSSIEITFDMVDGVAFLEDALITGNEKITLSLQQTNEETKYSLELEVYIAEIFDYARVKPELVVYKFLCFSEHMYINSTKKIVRAFNNSIGKLVETICTRDLGMDPSGVDITETSSIIRGIYPRMRPLTAINWLMRNAIENKSQFYFYESARDGIKFKSFKNLIDEKVYTTYHYNRYDKNLPLTQASYRDTKNKIKTISSNLNISKLTSLSEGAYGSTLHALDVSTKSYVKSTHNYDGTHMLNSNKPYSTNFKINNTPIDEITDSIEYFIATNKKAFGGDVKTYHTPLPGGLMAKQSHLENLDLITQNLLLPGDLDISVGNKIELNILKPTDIRAMDVKPKDNVLSGNHIITAITHKFSSAEYLMNLDVQKDSYTVSMDK